jgi:glycosyltransferase involved in cell wall biosynthesis
VYNGGRFLRETLKSVMIQALPEREMQIEVVDDCSTDVDVQALTREIGKGRIGYFRQPYNVGSLRNFATCLHLAKGHHVHLLHCDDLVLDGFYEHMIKLFTTYPHIGAAFCRYRELDEGGKVTDVREAEAPVPCVLENWLLRLADRNRIGSASIVVKRSVYENLGSFYGVHTNTEWEMWVRIASKYSFAYSPAVLASCRRHVGSATRQALLQGVYLRDMETLMKKVSDHLPKEQRPEALMRSKRYYAHQAVKMTKQMWMQHKNVRGVLTQMRKAWNMHKDPIIAIEIVRAFIRLLLAK